MSSNRLPLGSSLRLVAFLDVDDTLIITEDTELGRIRTLNQQLINQLKKNRINHIYLFTNMDLADVNHHDSPNRITRKRLISELNLQGITVDGVLTPADPVYKKGPGAAFNDLYLSAYGKKTQNQSYEEEDQKFKECLAKQHVEETYVGKKRAAGQKRSMFQYFLENKPADIASIIYFEDDKTCIDAVSELIQPLDSNIHFTTCQVQLHSVKSQQENKYYADVVSRSIATSKEMFLKKLKENLNNPNITKEDILDFFNEIKKKDGKYAYIHAQKNPTWDKFRVFFKCSSNKNEEKFWHTATYQKAVGILKEAYQSRNAQSVHETRVNDENEFIDYYRGNSPIHLFSTTTRNNTK